MSSSFPNYMLLVVKETTIRATESKRNDAWRFEEERQPKRSEDEYKVVI